MKCVYSNDFLGIFKMIHSLASSRNISWISVLCFALIYTHLEKIDFPIKVLLQSLAKVKEEWKKKKKGKRGVDEIG